MSAVRIAILSSPGERRVAVLDGSELVALAIDRPGAPDGVDDLYRGRVINPVPGMAGAFVALPGSPDGFLPDSAGAAGRGSGDLLGVRVTRAAQGAKGPRLTAMLDAAEAALAASGPARLIRRGAGAAARLAAAWPEAPVRVDHPATAAALRPALGGRVVVAPGEEPSLAAEIEALAGAETLLENGARLSFHPTPALVAIDIDAGGALAGAVLKAGAHLATNLGAVPELARQIRLRNLSGAILVDFAGLAPARRAKLAPALEQALHDDPLRPRLLGFTRLGLAEIVRPRVHPPLHELLAGPHAAGLAALRALCRRATAEPAARLALRAAPAVAAALLADQCALSELAERIGERLIPASDPSLPGLGWSIETRAAR